MKILQSTIERSLYVVLLLIFITNVIGLFISVSVISRLNQQQKDINNGIQNIQTQVSCISEFFLQPDRLNITLTNLKPCNKVINELNKQS